MKKIILTLFFLTSAVSAQVGYVEYNHPVYNFLERMDALHIIQNYNEFELPKTHSQIATYLTEAIKNKNRLTPVDENILRDFIVEFEYNLKHTTNNYLSLFSELNFSHFNSEKEKYLYFYTDKDKASLFVNFIGDISVLHQRNIVTGNSLGSTIFNFGGKIRGSLYNKIGFYIKGTNGTFSGNRNLAINTGSRRYNYKAHHSVTSSNLGKDFFDETEGYLMADFKYVSAEIGRNRKVLGYGPVKYLLSDNSPVMDYLSFNLNYKILNFSYFHGKLLGIPHTISDPSQGSINTVPDKFMAYHRIGLNFSKDFQMGLGEIVIYANRSIDLSYLNPFTFYKSVEHANQDRDNSMLFFDFANNSIQGLKFYSTIMLDDIDFGKLGTGWYGNQMLLNLGLYSANLYKYFPLEINLQYLRIDPYVFTHRILESNYTNLGYSLGTDIPPNSETFILGFNYHFTYRLSGSIKFNYTLHGANEVDKNNDVTVNHGGNISVGHRTSDSETVYFLEGLREVFRNYIFELKYEPINNILFTFSVIYTHNNLKNSQIRKDWISNLNLSLQF